MPSASARSAASPSTASSSIDAPLRLSTPSMPSRRQRRNSEFVKRPLEKIAPLRSQSWKRTQSHCDPVKSACRRLHESNVTRTRSTRRSADRSAETPRQTVSRIFVSANCVPVNRPPDTNTRASEPPRISALAMFSSSKTASVNSGSVSTASLRSHRPRSDSSTPRPETCTPHHRAPLNSAAENVAPSRTSVSAESTSNEAGRPGSIGVVAAGIPGSLGIRRWQDDRHRPPARAEGQQCVIRTFGSPGKG
jgi:hypothetical protein